jgi:very-short-patch-repair endonuclease
MARLISVRGIVIGSEMLASGRLTRQVLRTRYVKLHRDVYAPIGLELTACDCAVAAWLWSHRKAILVGSSAAAVLGTRWLPSDEPAELGRARYAASEDIVVRADVIADDERQVVRGMTCTSPARTAYDLGRRLDGETAVIRIDALLNATKVPAEQVVSIAERYPGARGVRRLRATLARVDGGAESPQETRLRLLLVESITPRPVTQIPVRNGYGRVVRRIDMGYPRWKVGVEYDGEQHFTNPDDYANDIERLEFLAHMGWIIVRVSARQFRFERDQIVNRVQAALAVRAT